MVNILLSRMARLAWLVHRRKIEAPARLMMASCSASCSCQGPGLVESPATRPTPGAKGRSFWVDRSSTVTSCPLAVSTLVRFVPTKPMPPVTKILIVSFLPFLLSLPGSTSNAGRFLWPWLYLSAVISLSYFTYPDPANLREYAAVRLTEYLPCYGPLIWAASPAISGAREPERG